MNRLVCLIAVLEVLFAACGGNPPAKSGSPPPPGVTQNLTRVQADLLFIIDELGAGKSPTPGTPTKISESAEIRLRGWAVDKPAGTPAHAVDVVIDNVPYAARYGDDRTDVADAFKQPAYRKTGFQFSVPASRFAKGVHTISIRIVASDGKSYSQTPDLSATIE